MYSSRDDLPVAADDVDSDPPWGSLLTIAGVVAGAGIAVLAWWGVGRWLEARWSRAWR